MYNITTIPFDNNPTLHPTPLEIRESELGQTWSMHNPTPSGGGVQKKSDSYPEQSRSMYNPGRVRPIAIPNYRVNCFDMYHVIPMIIKFKS